MAKDSIADLVEATLKNLAKYEGQHDEAKRWIVSTRRQQIKNPAIPFFNVTAEMLERLIEYRYSQFDWLGPDLAKFDERLRLCGVPIVCLPPGPATEFADAIRADPTDKALQLVFADWCEEHGYTDLAVLLRA